STGSRRASPSSCHAAPTCTSSSSPRRDTARSRCAWTPSGAAWSRWPWCRSRRRRPGPPRTSTPRRRPSGRRRPRRRERPKREEPRSVSESQRRRARHPRAESPSTGSMISDAASPRAEGACWPLPRRIALFFIIAVIAGAAVVAPARAESDESKAKARARMAEGVKLLDRKDYTAALAAFEEAYALVPSAKIQFNIGVAKRGLGRKAEALEAFEQFLEMSPFAPPASRAEAEKARDDLRQ